MDGKKGIVEVRKKRILVVDDDEAVRQSLRSILVMEGYNADIAGTGEEALEKLWSRHYDLIIINSRLPDWAGKELEMKILLVNPNCRTILLGMEPVIPEELLKTVEIKLRS